MANRKGQGISVNMMILIIMGIIVLLICIVLVTKQFKKGDSAIKNSSDCPVGTNGFSCQFIGACNGDSENYSYMSCPTPGQYCCKGT